MLPAELLELLRCPACARHTGGRLYYHRNAWLICWDCARKYPVRDGIAIMLLEEGERWRALLPEELPVPPPES
ncbi:MAG: Trm112 family protein [Bacteroidetes bacterium]|nr:Trm112 family protein [Rhodothermia bacterium]MCS7154206.1 Trm112 family protein [Bacteroidota bacterium]MCX7906758.1 Trm112 family protein [Bacteroidota bacterium]MDW8136962.1 Trm112 family protein [Bacteroidota bacterium]MDW8285167.1 Trm112 family protein [Bacteroidota bacterium]